VVSSSRRASRTGRSRFTLLLLVLTSVTVLTLDFRGAGAVDDLRGAASTVFSPIADAAGSVTRPITDAWNGAFGYDELQRENEDLRDRIAELEGDAAQGADAVRQLEEFMALNDVSRFTQLDSVVARVVGGSLTNFEHSIQLDRGTDDGVGVGMPVVTGAGLVGRVVAATGNRSTVQLITDPAFELGVRLASSAEKGIAHGTGEGEPLVVDEGIPVNVEDTIPDDEVVVTSGVDGSLFPPDIPVGRITDIQDGSDQLSLELTVEPLAELEDLGSVRVLLWRAEVAEP
jgi:rod shape-determining protein MreC